MIDDFDLAHIKLSLFFRVTHVPRGPALQQLHVVTLFFVFSLIFTL